MSKKQNPVVRVLHHIFIEGMSGMASGLFATLIIGTILAQIGAMIPGTVGEAIVLMGKAASAVTGAGIGIGVAQRLKAPVYVLLSAATAGMVGAFAAKILAGTFFAGGVVTLAGPGEPLGAFIAAMVAVEAGRLVAGKTKIDIIVTPMVSILSGGAVGLLIGPPISTFMTGLGALVNWGTEQQPVLMGVIVSVLMGMILTLPISSAAVGVVLNLSGIAAGAATVGCCANMIGFAVASWRENKFGGFMAQGLGTSMLQVANIMRRPVIWLPAILTSAILGPVSTVVLGMTSNATGAGMGTAGLVGPIMAYETMVQGGMEPWMVLLQIALMHFILPAVLSLAFSEWFRKLGWIRKGDMKLDL
ncbi:MAG: PTS sugar transporter subunit IIC [Clostridia bacterium]|nr:PTS sugar transporter subunit IIC [Clostridia bacterium]